MKVPFWILLSVLFFEASARPALAGVADEAPATLKEPSPWDGVPLSLWDYSYTPYGWLSGLEGAAGVGGQSVNLDVGFDDVLDALDVVWMQTFEMRKGRFGLLSDFMYVKLSTSAPLRGVVSSGADFEIRQLMLGFYGAYRILENDRTTVDLVAGTRYLWVKESLTLLPGSAGGPFAGTASRAWWDGVGGVRANHALSDRFFLSFYGDIGGGGSDLTWQLFGAMGYKVCPNASLLAGYRYLSYDYEDGGFIYDIDTKGPIIGMSIAF